MDVSLSLLYCFWEIICIQGSKLYSILRLYFIRIVDKLVCNGRARRRKVISRHIISLGIGFGRCKFLLTSNLFYGKFLSYYNYGHSLGDETGKVKLVSTPSYYHAYTWVISLARIMALAKRMTSSAKKRYGCIQQIYMSTNNLLLPKFN